MSFKGKKNIYVCEVCNRQIITVDVDDGTTPFMTRCRATNGCKGWMQSQFYHVDQKLHASFEWFHPPLSDDMSPAMRDHVQMGGLMLRAVSS